MFLFSKLKYYIEIKTIKNLFIYLLNIIQSNQNSEKYWIKNNNNDKNLKQTITSNIIQIIISTLSI